MAQLDHLIFASPDLQAGVDHIQGLTGATAIFGGAHVGVGTYNHLLTFDQDTYFEIIGIDPDQAAPSEPRPFGLDDLAAPALVGYAIHPTGDESLEDVVGGMREAGYDPGPISDMSRAKPDGSILSWRLTRGISAGGALPFAIDWGDAESPAVSLPSMGGLVSLTVSHPDPAVRASAEALDVGVAVQDGPVGLVAVVDTPNGSVEIR